ncbi:MAG: Uma2 family endonuclease [Thiohalocapsa sp.]
MAAIAHQPHLWTRAEYERLIETGGLHPDARLELIDGEILDVAAQKSRHSTAVQLVNDVLRNVFVTGFTVRSQLPLALDDYSEPEPDVAVVIGATRDYRDAHPGTALLIVEVADSSLTFDRGRKLALYARNGIEDYWILDVQAESLEVYREPLGDHYRQRQVLGTGDGIAPLHATDTAISVADLLP